MTTTKNIKLTPAQIEVIRLLQSGEWELNHSTRISNRAWLSDGSRVKDVKLSTFNALVLRGIIAKNHAASNWRLHIYRLTQAGRELKVD